LKKYYNNTEDLQAALKNKGIVTYVNGTFDWGMDKGDITSGEEEDGDWNAPNGKEYDVRAAAGIISSPVSDVSDLTDFGSVLFDWSLNGTDAEWITLFHDSVFSGFGGRNGTSLTDSFFKKYAFETGGLADFTGPAWLDGTKSRPEYVLNADQTERFFSLIDVLEGFDKNPTATEKSGDSYIDVDINVESIASDYDVEQLADKIRSMIYDDATYRNVNNVSHIR
jgi:hypothetical protein